MNTDIALAVASFGETCQAILTPWASMLFLSDALVMLLFKQPIPPLLVKLVALPLLLLCLIH